MPIHPTESRHSSAGYALHKLTVTLLLAMMWYSACASASGEDLSTSMFSFSGFGTLGVVHSSEERADFISTNLEATGAGYTHEWSAAVDSRIAGQVTAHFTPRLAAMLQVVSEQLYDNTYRPHMEWANLKFQLTPEFSFRAGRTVLPTFLVSDSLKVGYANTWVRPPVEIYTLVPITNSDGVDASYRWVAGNFIHTVSGSYGNANLKIPGGASADARRLWVISETAEYGAAAVHLSFMQARSDFRLNTLDALFAGLRQFGPQGAALADKYTMHDKLAQFIALGATYDPGEWFLMGEWGKRDLHSAFGESTAWYASGGYRLARLTPYLTYGEVKANNNVSDPGLTVSALPGFLAGPATGLNAGLNAVLGSIAIQRTISAGVRWDFMKNVDLKVQYDHTRLGAGSPGTLYNLQPDFQRGGSVNLFSATIDFVL